MAHRDNKDLPVIRIITSEVIYQKVAESDDRAREQLDERVRRLNGFRKMTDAIAPDRWRLKQENVTTGDS